MERPRLVASDVDGTLLAPLSELTTRTERAVAAVVASGVPFVLVSGRPPRWIPPVADPIGLDGLAVCSNGAVVYDLTTARVVVVHELDPVVLHDAAEVLERAMPGIRVAAERATGDTTFVSEYGYLSPWGDGAEAPRVPRAEVLGHPATKLLIRHPHLSSAEMAAAAGEVLDHSVDLTFSTGDGLIELAAGGITKASGLAEVCQRLGVSAEQVVAFGDMPNDVEMLRWAGHGVAMANAHEDVLAIADEITAPNTEDGVAQVLERWF